MAGGYFNIDGSPSQQGMTTVEVVNENIKKLIQSDDIFNFVKKYKVRHIIKNRKVIIEANFLVHEQLYIMYLLTHNDFKSVINNCNNFSIFPLDINIKFC